MSESSLERLLQRRLGRLLWGTLAGFALLALVLFTVLGEVALRRSLEGTADAVESLLGLYADPGGERTTVAPAMLADQLVGMGAPFLITRTVPDGEELHVYFLSADMPAKRIEPLRRDAVAPDEVRAELRRSIADRGRWRFAVTHRQAGEFDIYVAGSRAPHLAALGVLTAAMLLLVPVAGAAARRIMRRSVRRALEPLTGVVEATRAIEPEDLSRRVPAPTGVAEATELAEAVNRLVGRVERAHRSLEAFTADASHELRTPLTYLRAQVHWALSNDRARPELEEGLVGMGHELEATIRLVEDLLLIARGESCQLRVAREPFDLGETLEEVREITEALVAGGDVEVRADVPAPVRIVGDRAWTRHVLLNLASNAARYTDHGSIRFGVRVEDGHVDVAVADTGIGIPAEHLERIFDRFYRVDQSRSRGQGGAGLGLAIARLLIELQGGTIFVTSTPGEGSQFVVRLPQARGG